MARKNDFSWVNRLESLQCHFKVWSEGATSKDFDRFETIAKKNRKGACFFFPYHPDMLLPAAEILQKRQAESNDASIDRRLTIWGLWIAAIALVSSTIVGILQFFSKP